MDLSPLVDSVKQPAQYKPDNAIPGGGLKVFESEAAY